MHSLSVIIPVLNEEAILAETLLRARAAVGADAQILVVDGGSTDSSRDISLAAGATVVESPRGRGRQMNAGATLATGTVLLFLHADSHLPVGAWDEMKRCLDDNNVVGGNFLIEFDSPRVLPRIFAALYNSRSIKQRIFYGDSGIWVRASVFEKLGGFREAVLMEDYAFCLEMRKEVRWRAPREPVMRGLPAVHSKVTTSARRFEGNVGRTLRMVATWTLLHLLYRLGASTEVLERTFYPPSG